MRKGTITDWNDAKGFGFISPTPAGRKVFFHISDYAQRRYRPAIGQDVFYESISGERGDKAIHVVPVLVNVPRCRNLALPLVVVWIVVFFATTCVLVLTQELPSSVPILYLVVSSVTFAAYGADKTKAKTGAWRISEQSLHLLSLFGGWPGALLAQQYFHHKSRKTEFQFIFWFTVILNGTALGILTILGPEFIIAWLRHLANRQSPFPPI